MHLRVLGKHANQRGNEREDAYVLGALGVNNFKMLKKMRKDASPEDAVFLEHHRDGLNQLLESVNLRTNDRGVTRSAKCFRSTGISIRLDVTNNPNYVDIAKWARTSPEMLLRWYDQNHPRKAVERVAEMRPKKAKAS